jgi:hypothetical protein
VAGDLAAAAGVLAAAGSDLDAVLRRARALRARVEAALEREG